MGTAVNSFLTNGTLSSGAKVKNLLPDYVLVNVRLKQKLWSIIRESCSVSQVRQDYVNMKRAVQAQIRDYKVKEKKNLSTFLLSWEGC